MYITGLKSIVEALNTDGYRDITIRNNINDNLLRGYNLRIGTNPMRSFYRQRIKESPLDDLIIEIDRTQEIPLKEYLNELIKEFNISRPKSDMTEWLPYKITAVNYNPGSNTICVENSDIKVCIECRKSGLPYSTETYKKLINFYSFLEENVIDRERSCVDYLNRSAVIVFNAYALGKLSETQKIQLLIEYNSLLNYGQKKHKSYSVPVTPYILYNPEEICVGLWDLQHDKALSAINVADYKYDPNYIKMKIEILLQGLVSEEYNIDEKEVAVINHLMVNGIDLGRTKVYKQ